MATRIQVRRDTLANFTGVVPLLGEPIAIVGTAGAVSYKIGDGVSTVDQLPALSKGDKGDTGSRGLPGTNGIATDDAVATNIGTDGTKTQLAGDARYQRLAGTEISVAQYGAKADGVTDDTEAIHAAVVAAGTRAAAAGSNVTVVLMAGTHLVNFRKQDLYQTFWAGIELPANVTLRGMGRGATRIKLAPNQTQSGRIITNRVLDGGDKDITVSDLTVDGTGAQQTVYNQGIHFLRAQSLAVTRVSVRDVFGDGAYPPGETFFFVLDTCSRATFTDCFAIGASGTHGSGFGDNSSTNVSYTGCFATGMTAGMGFASWHGAAISYANCRAQKVGANGFNVEFGQDITYASCIAGGQASDQAANYSGLANSASLGCTGSGFVANGSKNVTYAACNSRRNGTGLSVVNAGSLESSVSVVGGWFTDNTAVGIYFGSPASAALSNVDGSAQVSNNPTSNFSINGGIGVFNGPSVPKPSTQTASGVVVPNPYPWPCYVYIDATTLYFVNINGGTIGPRTTVFLPKGATIQINYGDASPAIVWYRV